MDSTNRRSVTAVLELRDVSVGYGSAEVLHNVSLVAPSGAVTALLGANGAGKTTLMRVASGLLAPWSGQLLVDRRDVTRARPHELVSRGVCHIPEGRGIFPSLSVRDNLNLQIPRGERPGSSDRALEIFPALGVRLDQVAGTMSGGEQQMLALARAYLSGATTLLLDEVSIGLAPRVVDEIFDFLGILVQDGKTLLLVEQYVSRALAMSDYVYVLTRGQVAFAGEPEELGDMDLLGRYFGLTARQGHRAT